MPSSFRIVSLTSLLVASPCLADSFEITPAYRSGLDHHWRGTELGLHYMGEEISGWNFGAYLSSTIWRIDRKRRGQTIEGGPEIRYNWTLGSALVYTGLQYSLFSDGDFSVQGENYGTKILGPRVSTGCFYPLSSIVLLFGVSKGWETLRTYSDTHEHKPLESHSFLLGVSL